jgi:hypothetical protein
VLHVKGVKKFHAQRRNEESLKVNCVFLKRRPREREKKTFYFRALISYAAIKARFHDLLLTMISASNGHVSSYNGMRRHASNSRYTILSTLFPYFNALFVAIVRHTNFCTLSLALIWLLNCISIVNCWLFR